MSQLNKNVEDKLDAISSDLTEIKVTLGVHGVYHEQNTKSLVEHMSRTAAAEQRIEMLKTEVTALEKHKERVTGALQIVMVIGALIYALHSMGILAKIL